MPNFVFAYFGRPSFASDAESQAHMQEWRDWLTGLGNAVVDAGMPIAPGKTISECGVAPEASELAKLSGITVVETSTLEAAEALARSCPHLGDDRLIHVAPAMVLG